MVPDATLSRRDLCKIGSVSALSACVRLQAAQSEDTIVRSNRFLTIGLNRTTGKAFIEQKSSSEIWVWDWRQIRLADLGSFSSQHYQGLQVVQPTAITPSAEGFALDYQEPWGRSRCSVTLADTDVLFRVEPDVRYPCARQVTTGPFCWTPSTVAACTRPVTSL